ncbi:phage major capsid protein [Pediococcus argentinicus]|uniref:phage major capsid protein n=1 Tax=Pediococcus argentinicus TaxID=480391 RepID=UPI0033902121
MKTLKKELEQKRSELKAKITEARSLLEKDVSVKELKQSEKEVTELRDAIKKLKSKIEVLEVIEDDERAKKPSDTKDTPAKTEDPKSDGSDDGKSSTDDPKKQKKDKRDDLDDDDDSDDDADDSDLEKDSKDGAKSKRSLQKEGKDMPQDLTKQNKENKQVRSIEEYIRSHGEKRDAGLTTGDVGAMIPEQIIYNPESEIDSVADLSQHVTQTPASTASGTYPIVARATAKMNTVAELAENPDLAKPSFTNVKWEIATYRGQIPISEESIADTQVPLMPVIQKNAQEQRLNTLNDAISKKLLSFNAKSSTSDTLVDDIKHILNVDLDPAYNKSVVVSQSAYQILDTLKDKEGRYLLQQSITVASGITLLGIQVIVVNDELLGKVGEAHLWIGDLKRAILYVNRLDTQIGWVKNEIFGQYLALAMRFDVEVADAKAGYFVTVSGGATSTPAPKGN